MPDLGSVATTPVGSQKCFNIMTMRRDLTCLPNFNYDNAKKTRILLKRPITNKSIALNPT